MPYCKRLRSSLHNLFLGAILTVFFLFFAAINAESKDSAQPLAVVHPSWAYGATIYEVNLRQYSDKGTFKDFETQLPRLQKLGVKILWFMPINPIGELNRKGPLGSYYSVKDYEAVNSEYGTIDDFKQLVKTAHNLGLKIIIDWVPNHTSWDSPWITQHPDWYSRDSTGKMFAPFDWTDVAQLNYKNMEMRAAMIDAMKFWINEADIDGFRCDVAHNVPVDFWNDCRVALDKVKPVFMLAEAEKPELVKQAFDADYGWDNHHLLNDIAKGKKNADSLAAYLQKDILRYPNYSFRMLFTSNHDENAWAGTEFERMGDAAKTFAVLTFTLPGFPLIYTGQEVGFNRRLKFFEKDPVDWTDRGDFTKFYQTLTKMKASNPALWNGEKGADLERVRTNEDNQAFIFVRKTKDNQVFALFNLSAKPVKTILKGNAFVGSYKAVFGGAKRVFKANQTIELKPWEYLVYTKSK